MRVTPFAITLPFLLGGAFCISRTAQDELGEDREGLYADPNDPRSGVWMYLVQSREGDRPVLAEWRFKEGREWISLIGTVCRGEVLLGRGPGNPWMKGSFKGDCLEIEAASWGERARGARPDPNEWFPSIRYETICPYRPATSSSPAPTAKHVELRRIASVTDLQFRDGDISTRCIFPLPSTGEESIRLAVRRARDEALQRTKAEFEAFKAEREEEEVGLRRYEECWLVDSLSPTGISLVCCVSCYSGGAHSNYWYWSKTLWLDDGVVREMGLADLFNPCTFWQDALAGLVCRRLESAGTAWLTGFDVDSLRNWALTPVGIEFFFAPYEVDCFAAGSFSAFISYDEIRGLLNPVGPVSQFLP